MLKRPLISQNSVIFHHLATFACNIYLDFWKGGSWRFAHFHRNDTETGFFGLPWAYNHGREKRREGIFEKRTAGGLEIVSERQKIAADTPHFLDTSAERCRFHGYILAWNGLKMPAHQPEFGHFSPCNIYLDFWKGGSWTFAHFARKLGFLDSLSLQTTRERKEKGGERGEKKKGLLALIIFILPTLEIVSERQKVLATHRSEERYTFSKIRVYWLKW